MNAVVQTNQILRFVRSLRKGLEDFPALDAVLDASELMTDAYVLEISSPGLSSELTTEQDFTSFKGFPVMVQAASPYRGHQEWTGTLIGRDQQHIHLNQKGRAIKLPRDLITLVKLQDSS